MPKDVSDLPEVEQETGAKELRRLSVRAVTWNVASAAPGESLMSVLDPNGWISTGESELPDIFAVGLQEVDLSPVSLVTLETAACKSWSNWIDISLEALATQRSEAVNHNSDGEQYVRLIARQYVGLFFAVYIRQSLHRLVSGVHSAIACLGFGGVAGNKGAIGVSLCAKVDGQEKPLICLINCHLKPHGFYVRERNEQYKQTLARLRFGVEEAMGATSVSGMQAAFWGSAAGSYGVDDHDSVIWIGDLNYRLSGDVASALALIESRDWPKLWERDQLLLARSRKQAFVSFKEAALTFAPTYKLRQDGFYKTEGVDSSGAPRIPSWTDRILWRNDKIECKDYISEKLMSSDHFPVAAHLVLPVDVDALMAECGNCSAGATASQSGGRWVKSSLGVMRGALGSVAGNVKHFTSVLFS